MEWTTAGLGLDSRQELEIFLSLYRPGQLWGSATTPSPFSRYRGTLSSSTKWPGCIANHSYTSPSYITRGATSPLPNTPSRHGDLFNAGKTLYLFSVSYTSLLVLKFWPENSVKEPQRRVKHRHEGKINPLKTKRRLLHLKTQFVPRSKHFSSRL